MNLFPLTTDQCLRVMALVVAGYSKDVNPVISKAESYYKYLKEGVR